MQSRYFRCFRCSIFKKFQWQGRVDDSDIDVVVDVECFMCCGRLLRANYDVLHLPCSPRNSAGTMQISHVEKDERYHDVRDQGDG